MQEVEQLCDDFVSDLRQAEPNPEDWVRWFVYCLESLQDGTDSEGYQAFLRGVMDAIDSRLEFGRW